MRRCSVSVQAIRSIKCIPMTFELGRVHSAAVSDSRSPTHVLVRACTGVHHARVARSSSPRVALLQIPCLSSQHTRNSDSNTDSC
jgi:hypothetical protein